MIEQGSVTAAWVIYAMMFGYPISTNDTNEFDNQTACQIYLHTRERTGSIDVRTERDVVVLTYQTRHDLATEWKPISQRVPITWTDLHFGRLDAPGLSRSRC